MDFDGFLRSLKEVWPGTNPRPGFTIALHTRKRQRVREKRKEEKEVGRTQPSRPSSPWPQTSSGRCQEWSRCRVIMRRKPYWWGEEKRKKLDSKEKGGMRQVTRGKGYIDQGSEKEVTKLPDLVFCVGSMKEVKRTCKIYRCGAFFLKMPGF